MEDTKAESEIKGCVLHFSEQSELNTISTVDINIMAYIELSGSRPKKPKMKRPQTRRVRLGPGRLGELNHVLLLHEALLNPLPHAYRNLF